MSTSVVFPVSAMLVESCLPVFDMFCCDIVVRASSGLSDDEVDRMVKDAEAHAAEDRKFHELVDARNQADNLIHATNKSLKELGDKVSAEEQSSIATAIGALQEAMKGDDKSVIEEKTNALAEVSGKLAERVYKESAQPAGGSEQAGAQGGEADSSGKSGSGDDVVDAEFEEVNDERK